MAGQFIHNTLDPNCGPQSLSFFVQGDPVVVTAVGLQAGDEIVVERSVSGTCTANGRTCGAPITYWSPVVRSGCPVVITADAPEYIELLPGSYRINISGVATADFAVLAEALPSLQDKYVFGYSVPPCPAGGGGTAPPASSVVCLPAALGGVATSWG